MKIEVVTNKEYVLYFEFVNPITILHCDCFKWNKSVKKNLLADFNTLCSVFRKDIYCAVEEGNTKLFKFAALLDFEYVTSFVGTDNIHRKLFIRKY